MMDRYCLFCGCHLQDFPANNTVRLRQRICKDCWASTLRLSAEELAVTFQQKQAEVSADGARAPMASPECESGTLDG